MILKGDERSGAMFSDDMQYRYRLWRCWDVKLPRACFCLLNPSRADEIDNDPTIERQQRRVVSWGIRGLLPELGIERFLKERRFPRGLGSIEIVNAFALRSTNPRGLYHVDDPIGPENDPSILNATTSAIGSGGIVICGWGGHAAQVLLGAGVPSRHQFLCAYFQRHNIPLAAFGLNDDDTPQHPLYLSYDRKPRQWNPSTAELGLELV